MLRPTRTRSPVSRAAGQIRPHLYMQTERGRAEVPCARIVSILDLSLCLSSMMGRAVNAESMAAIEAALTVQPGGRVL